MFLSVNYFRSKHHLCVLASQVGPKGKVIGIDHIKELVDDSLTNVKKDDPNFITSGRVTLMGEVELLKCNIVFVCGLGLKRL